MSEIAIKYSLIWLSYAESDLHYMEKYAANAVKYNSNKFNSVAMQNEMLWFHRHLADACNEAVKLSKADRRAFNALHDELIEKERRILNM